MWCLSRVPDGVTPGYEGRGWCTFEQIVGTAIKKNHYHLDIGALSCDPMLITDWGAQVEADPEVDRRLPPPTLECFEALLAQKKFTNGKTDHPLVLRLYEAFLRDALGYVEALDYSHLGWGIAQVGALAQLLRALVCQRLRSLDLSNNDIGDDGLRALASALPPSLEVLNLSANHAITDAGAAALASGLPATLRVLDLSSFHGRRPQPLSCPNDAPRTLDAVDIMVEFYSADPAQRQHLLAREAERRAAVAEAVAGAPATVIIDGIVCQRRLWCSTGTRMVDGWRLALAGVWTLAVDDPLLDGAPHYEMIDADGDVSHLYRITAMRGNAKVWYAGPTAGSDGGVAVAWVDALHPQEIGAQWDVSTEEKWEPDATFRFTELVGAQRDGGRSPGAPPPRVRHSPRGAPGDSTRDSSRGGTIDETRLLAPTDSSSPSAGPTRHDGAQRGLVDSVRMRFEMRSFVRSGSDSNHAPKGDEELDDATERLARRRGLSARWRKQQRGEAAPRTASSEAAVAASQSAPVPWPPAVLKVRVQSRMARLAARIRGHDRTKNSTDRAPSGGAGHRPAATSDILRPVRL